MHVVVSAHGYKPKLVRDQLKAKATKELRRSFAVWENRPVWTERGDIEFLDHETDIEQCVMYVAEAQDRMNRDEQRPVFRESQGPWVSRRFGEP